MKTISERCECGWQALAVGGVAGTAVMHCGTDIYDYVGDMLGGKLATTLVTDTSDTAVHIAPKHDPVLHPNGFYFAFTPNEVKS